MRYVDTPRGRLSHKLRDGKYRARKAGCSIVPFTLNEACDLLLTDSECYYCGTDINLSGTCGYGEDGYALEHKTPLAKGGEHSLSNLAKACQECNQTKYIQEALDFIAWLDGEGLKE